MRKTVPFTEQMIARWREVEDLETGVHAMTERLGKMHRMFWEEVRQHIGSVPPTAILTISKATNEIVWYEPDPKEEPCSPPTS